MFVERKHWSPKEDQILVSIVEEIGTANWTLVSLKLSQKCQNSLRTGKQCRQRWSNYINKKVENRPWNDDEEQLLFQLHKTYGNKWKQIAKKLNNRVQGQIKNHVYAVIRKGIRRMNKFTGMKIDPSQIRTIKPSIMTQVCIEDMNHQNLIPVKSQQKSAMNLILKFSKNKLVDKEIQTLLGKSNITKTIETILHKFITKNEEHERNKKRKMAEMKDRKVRHLFPQGSMQDQRCKEQLYSLDVNQFLNFQISYQLPRHKSVGNEAFMDIESSEYSSSQKSDQMEQVSRM